MDTFDWQKEVFDKNTFLGCNPQFLTTMVFNIGDPCPRGHCTGQRISYISREEKIVATFERPQMILWVIPGEVYTGVESIFPRIF